MLTRIFVLLVGFGSALNVCAASPASNPPGQEASTEDGDVQPSVEQTSSVKQGASPGQSLPLEQQLPGACPDNRWVASGKWKIHDRKRPQPQTVAPKSEAELAASAKPPSGAIVLFNGKDLSAWKPATQWKVENGYVESVPWTGTHATSGYLSTKENFGSCRLHLEWSTLNPPVGSDQARGNSGVFLMARYELQVLDTYNNPTYIDGMAGSIYGQSPPLVNPIRPPGQWQYYDIVFHRPIFDASEKLVKPATITVDFNGIRVQDNTVIEGITDNTKRHGYQTRDARTIKAPLELQLHACVVRYRNIWLEPIAD